MEAGESFYAQVECCAKDGLSRTFKITPARRGEPPLYLEYEEDVDTVFQYNVGIVTRRTIQDGDI